MRVCICSTRTAHVMLNLPLRDLSMYSGTWIRLDRLDRHDMNQYSCSHVVSVTQVQIFEEEWDTYFLGVNIRICPVVPSTAPGFPMQPVATAKAQENGQCHNHGLAHNAQTMGEYSGCHRMSWFVKPTGWYSHLGALWIVARSWTMRKTIYYLRWFGHTFGAYPKSLQHPKWEESFHKPRVWSIPWACWIFS